MGGGAGEQGAVSAIFQRFVERGGSFVDTALNYGGGTRLWGRSERVVELFEQGAKPPLFRFA